MSSDTQVLLPDFALIENRPPKRRIVIAIDGRDRQGKTHFTFTAPSPIMYFDFDMGSEGMAEKFVADSVMQGQFEHAGKIIVRSSPFVVRPPEASTDSKKDNQGVAQGEWLRLYNGYLHGLSKPIIQHKGKAYKARTLVIDTGSEMEELMRLAFFGQLTQVPTFLYRERNSIMRDIVRRALESDVNVIFTHKLSAEWTKNAAGGDQAKQSKTGAYERKGYEEMAHLVQANLFAYRCPPPGSIPVTWKYKPGTGEPHSWTANPREASSNGFVVRCLDSRQNPELEGFEWEGDAATFANVAMLLQPDSTDADWANAHD